MITEKVCFKTDFYYIFVVGDSAHTGLHGVF